MTPDERHKVLDRIKKLMALGQSSFDEEARTSLHLAFKLMKQHGISLADVAGASAPQDNGTVNLTYDDINDLNAEAITDYMAYIGSKGGKKGGVTRARKLTAKRRREIARKAGQASGEARRRKTNGTSG